MAEVRFLKYDTTTKGTRQHESTDELTLNGVSTTGTLTTSGALSVTSSGTFATTGSGTFDIGSSGNVTFSGNPTIDFGTGQADFGGNLDANAGLDVTGNLTQGTGTVTLTANGASSFTTSSGALTLTSAAAATWSTDAGILTLDGAGGVAIAGNAGEIDLTTSGALDLNSGAMTWNGTTALLTASSSFEVDAVGAIQVNSSTSTISIGNDDIDQAINIGTNGERTITIGNTTGVTGVAIDTGTGNLTVTGNQTITGNLTVQGTTTTVESETVKIADNHLYLNDGYTTTASPQTGGLVVNYNPTATTDTVGGTAGFTAGTGTTNPTVSTTGANTFSASDLIQISGAANEANNGLFEVLSHAANVLTIRGVGATGTVEDFTQNQFVTDSTISGTITQVNVSVIRAGTDGTWESGKGSTTGISFTAFASANLTLNDAYENGATITIDAQGPVTLTSDNANDVIALDINAGDVDRVNPQIQVGFGTATYTGTPIAVNLDYETATLNPSGAFGALRIDYGAATLNDASDIYGQDLIGATNAGAGDSIGINFDSGWDYGFVTDSHTKHLADRYAYFGDDPVMGYVSAQTSLFMHTGLSQASDDVGGIKFGLNTQQGGDASAGAAGAGGEFKVELGDGGLAADNLVGGAGGLWNLGAGTGGDASTGTGTAGAGGSGTLSAGSGGAASAANPGGTGGSITITAGQGGGGAASTAGDGGDITINAGGTGVGGVAGTAGDIDIGTTNVNNLTLGNGVCTTLIDGGGSGGVKIQCSENDIDLDNTHVTSQIFATLGTDTSATWFAVRNNSGTEYLRVDGSGAVDVSDGTLDVPAGTSFKVNGVALTTANFTAANIDTLLNGSDADALHIHNTQEVSIPTAAGVTQNYVVYISGSNDVAHADADAIATGRAIGVAKTTVGAAGTAIVIISGVVTAQAAVLTVGAPVYLSTTAGQVTATAPVGSGDVVAELGIALTTSTYIWQPKAPVVLT